MKARTALAVDHTDLGIDTLDADLATALAIPAGSADSPAPFELSSTNAVLQATIQYLESDVRVITHNHISKVIEKWSGCREYVGRGLETGLETA
jgi:hypothetical protein|eukprot:3645079-Prymnesium_polylepis.1